MEFIITLRSYHKYLSIVPTVSNVPTIYLWLRTQNYFCKRKRNIVSDFLLFIDHFFNLNVPAIKKRIKIKIRKWTKKNWKPYKSGASVHKIAWYLVFGKVFFMKTMKSAAHCSRYFKNISLKITQKKSDHFFLVEFFCFRNFTCAPYNQLQPYNSMILFQFASFHGL